MTTTDEAIDIPVGGQSIAGTLVTPETSLPGVLFVHGWGGTQEHYLARAREIATLGCICLTIDLRGHGRTEGQYETVTREENLNDLLAAYDTLARHPSVNASAIAVVGSSYGGYLATILTSLRPVRWLALRAPALYRDEDWALPKQRLNRDEIAAYRRKRVRPEDNRALAACAAYEGDALVVECERDTIIPHPVIANYRTAFDRSRSLTYRVIADADHGLTEKAWQAAYTSLLVTWAAEMILGSRSNGGAPPAQARTWPIRRSAS
ncbi:alpha/beta hydrolase family protein [Skermanella pratensis]|uniref:alpha/beta hydrolase family protein n=1 Tax=Skermanella pratensis TaxID=2233999 RepID=UPI001300FC1A|nr:alpha/beta fold hydrolase [Skermanella pratensis]